MISKVSTCYYTCVAMSKRIKTSKLQTFYFTKNTNSSRVFLCDLSKNIVEGQIGCEVVTKRDPMNTVVQASAELSGKGALQEQRLDEI